jgi:hypothetical protein
VKADEIGAEILESCRRGDRDAFRALYEAHKDRLGGGSKGSNHERRSNRSEESQLE